MSQNVGRIALRVEGDNWVAYYAEPGTMKDAIFLASIRMALVRDEKRKQAFIDLMKDAIAAFMPAEVESWNVEPAPESERSGHA